MAVKTDQARDVSLDAMQDKLIKLNALLDHLNTRVLSFENIVSHRAQMDKEKGQLAEAQRPPFLEELHDYLDMASKQLADCMKRLDAVYYTLKREPRDAPR